MSDTRGKRKRLLIHVHRPGELRIWAKYFGCTQQDIRDAVKTSGVTAEDVHDWLKRNVIHGATSPSTKHLPFQARGE